MVDRRISQLAVVTLEAGDIIPIRRNAENYGVDLAGYLSGTGGAALVGTASGSTVEAALALKADNSALAGKANTTSLAANSGAALIGTAAGVTVEAALGLKLGATTLGTVNLGALPAGTTASVNPDKSFSGHSGGTTDYRGWVDVVRAGGTNAIAQVNARNVQVEITTTAGASSSFGTQSYIRAGLSGVGAVNVTSMRVNDSHVANEGTGTVTAATCYFADGVDLLDGTGPIQTMMAFYAGDQGHATRVTTAAIGYNCADFTTGAPLTAAFRSQMTSGTNKYGLYFDGNAPSIHAGMIAIGSGTAPTDMVEIRNGYLKASGTTTFLAAGSYHEMRSANASYITKLTNNHATTPDGLHVKFTGGAPNNTTQRFLLLDDTTSTKFEIFSTGKANSLVGFQVAGTDVVKTRRTGWTAPTGTSTRTGFATSTATATQVAEALKALIDDLIAHGLIGA
jgi:hypothetical protein